MARYFILLSCVLGGGQAQRGPPPDNSNSGDSGSGSAGCTNPTCASPPCAAALLGDVGCTTVSGTETYNHELLSKGDTIASGSHIFGPFEGGFSSKQDSIIQGWGCADPSLVYDTAGGMDVAIAEEKVAHKCGIELPKIDGDSYLGVVGPCGGHTNDYHFHVRFACLYTETGGHSTQVGQVADKFLYGKWEDFASNKLPLLDACGGHFGYTPDSPSVEVYHYHVQDKAPFSVGCHGPDAQGNLVSISTCRSLYSECTDTSGYIDVETARGNVAYARYCPCYDATGSNRGTAELPALSASVNWYSASGSTPTPTSGSTPSPPTPSPPGSTPSPPTPSPPGSTPSPTTAPTLAPGTAGIASRACDLVPLTTILIAGLASLMMYPLY